jgi:hypothetical protein
MYLILCSRKTPRVLSFEPPVSLSPLSDLVLLLSPLSSSLAHSPIEPASSFGCVCSTLTLGLVLVFAFSLTEQVTSSRTHSQLN